MLEAWCSWRAMSRFRRNWKPSAPSLERRLGQSEKLLALGQFVAGVAHELNNPLQGVLGHLELVRASSALPASLRRDLALVYREADRAARIVHNLLVFAGSGRLRRRALAVNAVVARVLRLRARGAQGRADRRRRELADGAAQGERRRAAPAAGAAQPRAERRAGDGGARRAAGRRHSADRERPSGDQRGGQRAGPAARSAGRACSSRFSPPRKSARARAWDWRSPTGSSRPTAARSKPTNRDEAARGS